MNNGLGEVKWCTRVASCTRRLCGNSRAARKSAEIPEIVDRTWGPGGPKMCTLLGFVSASNRASGRKATLRQQLRHGAKCAHGVAFYALGGSAEIPAGVRKPAEIRNSANFPRNGVLARLEAPHAATFAVHLPGATPSTPERRLRSGPPSGIGAAACPRARLPLIFSRQAAPGPRSAATSVARRTGSASVVGPGSQASAGSQPRRPLKRRDGVDPRAPAPARPRRLSAAALPA